MPSRPHRLPSLLTLALAIPFWGASAQESGTLVAKGRALYAEKCTQCHGIEGNGAGTASDRVRPRPRDFTSGAYKIRTTPSGELPTDDDLAAVIRNGMPYTAMPAWSRLQDSEVAALVAYLKTFNEDFSDPEMLVPALEIPPPPPFSEESARAGREVYQAAKCFECHGDQGRGDGVSGPTLKDDWGQPIQPADLTKRWTFRGGAGRGDIYRTFTTGLNGTPMPSYADSIPEAERWQLVDYVFSLSRDEPGYDTLLVASRVDADLEPDPQSDVFDAAQPAFFAVVGQVIDPGRLFSPRANAVEARAVYNREMLAIQLRWNAMVAATDGQNRPAGREPLPEGSVPSDAVAVQLPSALGEGPAKPYFLYGDATNGVDLWFYDAGRGDAAVYRGNGAANLAPYPDGTGPEVRAGGAYEAGQWRVVFVTPLRAQGAAGDRFPESAFVPIAFSIWTGHAGETGNRRGITSWHFMYLAPPETGVPYAVAAGMALFTLVAELGIAARVRRGRRSQNVRD